ncbi:MAG TPA: 8-oxo-dGTP diphosphatase MutT, partial [Verrucomicrobiales bacterium]|nr:8-oxo-dGTP diphosphatase MutT [Verrucomicrobiales bacterium]
MLEVVCAIILREHEILLCQRAPGQHLAGSWEFPGGKV